MNRRTNSKPTKFSAGKTQKSGAHNSKPYKDKAETDRNTKMCANDPSWYIREGQLAKDVASLSFNTAIGVNTNIDADFGSGAADLQPMAFSAPGIMTIHTVAAPGYSNSATSPINIAAKNLYSFIRHANSGHSNYDSPDLMLYFLAMDSAFNLIYYLQRAIGVSTLFSQKNRYIGDALLTSMGIEANNFRQNLAQYRARLNMSIVKASVFCVPAVFTLFKRHAWMYSNLFADSPVDKAQLYLYVPSIVHKYVETDGVGYLDPVPTCAWKAASGETLVRHLDSFGYYCNVLDELLGALQASEDINIMSGDILKAYGRENCFSLTLVPENYTIAPIYSEEILDQIHNTRFAGVYPRKPDIAADTAHTFSLEGLRIKQDPSIGAGNLLFTPAFENAEHLSYEAIIDMADNEPTPERVLVGTRNTIGGMSMHTADRNGWLTFLSAFGSDIPLFAVVYRTGTDGNLTPLSYYTSAAPIITNPALSYLLAFHKAPLLPQGNVDTAAQTYTIAPPLGSLENYTIIGSDELNKMHQSAILSMLGVPV